MSGPATAAFSFAPFGAIALAALALREAQAMGREYQDVLEEVSRRSQELADARQEAQSARIEERKVLHNRALQTESRLNRLRNLLEGVENAAGVRFVSGLPQALPVAADMQSDGWRDHIAALEAEAVRMQVFIREHSAPVSALEEGLAPGDAMPIDEALHSYMVQRAMRQQLDPQQSEAVRLLVARILQRLDLESGEPVPTDVDHLAQAIVLAPDLARADMLSMELRRMVQKQCEAKAVQRAAAQEARNLLASMAEDAPAELVHMLEAGIAGERPLDASVLELARTTLAAIEKQRTRLQEEAAAQVLEHSLRDLGYEVEGVENTFFIEGGVAHFQRQGWGEYFVRMRVGVQDKTLNFNVVRARGAHESAERRRVDAMAEDRWCSEFPRMLQTLQARGIVLDVKRLLGAGELPVQVVDAASLPAQTAEQQRAASPKLQEIKR